jgi:hypothetical protein
MLMDACVEPDSRTSMVEVVENFSTAPGSCRMTWRGEPIARITRTTDGESPRASAVAPTSNIVRGSPSTSVAAVNSRIRVS